MIDEEFLIKRHIAALRDDAAAMEATAKLFQPEFHDCWERKPDGSMGKMLDGERAMQLKPLVVDNRSNARYNRDLANAVERLWKEAHPTYTCTGGHDFCHGMMPGPQCAYCEKK